MENLLGSSEYDVASTSVFNKFAETLQYFHIANLGMSWILPVFFIVLLWDKKRKENTHRFAYLGVSVLWTILFIIGVMKDIEIYKCAISLPFSVISVVCYLLTENKNKKLFYCMCINKNAYMLNKWDIEKWYILIFYFILHFSFYIMK